MKRIFLLILEKKYFLKFFMIETLIVESNYYIMFHKHLSGTKLKPLTLLIFIYWSIY